jgi:hypothetical protein
MKQLWPKSLFFLRWPKRFDAQAGKQANAFLNNSILTDIYNACDASKFTTKFNPFKNFTFKQIKFDVSILQTF